LGEGKEKRELKRVAEEPGVRIYEHSKATDISRDELVNRQRLSDITNQVHDHRLTDDNRILWGGAIDTSTRFSVSQQRGSRRRCSICSPVASRSPLGPTLCSPRNPLVDAPEGSNGKPQCVAAHARPIRDGLRLVPTEHAAHASLFEQACIGRGYNTSTCWDQWFPELARKLSMDGAEVIVYPAANRSEPHRRRGASFVSRFVVHFGPIWPRDRRGAAKPTGQLTEVGPEALPPKPFLDLLNHVACKIFQSESPRFDDETADNIDRD
jgi:hypothetical protein